MLMTRTSDTVDMVLATGVVPSVSEKPSWSLSGIALPEVSRLIVAMTLTGVGILPAETLAVTRLTGIIDECNSPRVSAERKVNYHTRFGSAGIIDNCKDNVCGFKAATAARAFESNISGGC